MLDILDKYKVNPRILEGLQKQARRDQSDVDLNIFDWKLETKRHLMNTEKGFLVQHRREYYNDFEDCLRDYKNAKIKSIQKQTKVHLSDGDNGDSDSEYVDCNDSGDLKNQTLSSKSMSHVPSGNYGDNFCHQVESKQLTTKRNEIQTPPATATTQVLAKAKAQSQEHETEQKPEQTQTPVKAQLNTNYDVLRIKHETSAQLLTSHNNNHNQIIDTSCINTLAVIDVGKVSESKKPIAIDDNIHGPSTSIDNIKAHVNQKTADEQSKLSEAVKSTPVQFVDKKNEQTKRKSCKKRLPDGGAVKDSSQR